MTAPPRRTLSVRGWFVLAAVATFLVVIAMAVIGARRLNGEEPQARAARAADVLRHGADDWDDTAWRDATADRLAGDDVQFVLFQDDAVLYSSHPGPTDPDALPARPPWAAVRDDAVVRFVEIDGTTPRLTAYVFTPLERENLRVTIPLATVLIGTVAAAVSLAVGRVFVHPLRAAQQAAHQVARGAPTAALPRSRVTEIDEVSLAFRSMTAELHRSLEQQAALEDERRLFIAAIAHDLRTPLFALRGYLAGLDTPLADTPERRAQYLAVANEKARTLEQLVSDLFDYTTLEYLDLSLEYERLDLAELLRDLVEGVRHRADARRATLTFGPMDRPCPIDGDRRQLARAIDNILDNALRYTPSGGVIAVTCGVDGDAAWFRVDDTGPGIARGDLPHLFQPLYRGDRSRDTGNGGAGLGLAIAHRILSAHHGDLTAENRPTGGARFTATIPSGAAASGHQD